MPKRPESFEVVLRFQRTADSSPAREMALDALWAGRACKVRHIVGALKEDGSTSAAVIVRVTR